MKESICVRFPSNSINNEVSIPAIPASVFRHFSAAAHSTRLIIDNSTTVVREKRKITERPNGSPWHERGDSLNGLQWSNTVSIRRAPKTFESDDKAAFYPVMIRFPPPAFRVRFWNFFNNFLRELKEELASVNETGKWRRIERPNKIIFTTINIDETKRVWVNDCYCYRNVVIEKKKQAPMLRNNRWEFTKTAFDCRNAGCPARNRQNIMT